jgi:hypothetical protein
MKNVNSMRFHYDYLFFNELEKLGLSKENYCISGGALRDYLLEERVKDIDVFVASKEAEDSIIEKLRGIREVKVLSETPQIFNITYKKRWFQIIKNKYYNLSNTSLIDSFDYTICCAMLTHNEFKCHPRFFEDTLTKRLVINRLDFPLSSLQRLQKYIKKGYTICNVGMLDLSKAIAKIDFNNPSTNQLEFYPDKSPRFRGVD